MSKKQVAFRGLGLLIAFAISFGVVFKIYNNMKPPQPPQMPPPQVTIAEPIEEFVSRYDDFTGTTKSVQSVQVRARVAGYLKSIEFEDSTDVKKGDLLFVIEPESYQAKRDKAYANLKSSEAELKRTELDLQRVEKAVKTNSVSVQEVSTKVSERDKAEASVLAFKAELADAELQLGYTKVYSPLDGRVSRNLVDAGNLVGAGENTLLTTVVQLDPLYVYFNMNERTLLKRINGKSLNCSGDDAVEFQMGLANEKGYPHTGILDYIDNTVDSETGTIRVRGKLDNKDQKILPGMFARVRVPDGAPEKSLLVSERGLGTDFYGKYLFVVGADNIVEQRPVVIGKSINGMRVILEGLEKGEKIIISGLQFARGGMPVVPVFEQKTEALSLAKEEPKTKLAK